MIPVKVTPQTTVLVVDVQERLLSVMGDEGARVVAQASTLTALAGAFGARVVYTEQYPKGLGPTHEGLKAELDAVEAAYVDKVHFDALGAPDFDARAGALGERVVLCGMETHICVLATARSLIERGHQVLVPFDAVCSRYADHKANGLEQLRQAGALITNTETLVFGTLGNAKHPHFKTFSKRIAAT